MEDTVILVGYLVGCLYLAVSGFLLFFSPRRYVQFLSVFVVWGEKPKPKPDSDSMAIRIAGLFVAVLSFTALTLPIYWSLRSKEGQQIVPPTRVATTEYGWGIWIGLLFLIAFSLFMLVMPLTFLRWATRKSVYAVNIGHISRVGLLWVRAVGAIILSICIYGAWHALN